MQVDISDGEQRQFVEFLADVRLLAVFVWCHSEDIVVESAHRGSEFLDTLAFGAEKLLVPEVRIQFQIVVSVEFVDKQVNLLYESVLILHGIVIGQLVVLSLFLGQARIVGDGYQRVFSVFETFDVAMQRSIVVECQTDTVAVFQIDIDGTVCTDETVAALRCIVVAKQRLVYRLRVVDAVAVIDDVPVGDHLLRYGVHEHDRQTAYRATVGEQLLVCPFARVAVGRGEVARLGVDGGAIYVGGIQRERKARRKPFRFRSRNRLLGDVLPTSDRKNKQSGGKGIS